MDTFAAVYRVYFWGAPLLAAALTLSALLAGFSWLTRPIYLSDTDLVTVSTDEEGYVSVVSFDKQVTRCRVIETFELVEEAEDPERDIYEDNLGLLLWYTPLERLLRGTRQGALWSMQTAFSSTTRLMATN